MPALDYQKAKAAGYSDDQIRDFILKKRAAGEDYYIDKASLRSAGPNLSVGMSPQGAEPLVPKPVRNVVGAIANFAGALYSTPKAALVKALSGNQTPVTFSPTASYEQFKELASRMNQPTDNMAIPTNFGINPMAADIVTDVPFAMGLNALGKNVALPIGRVVANAEIGGVRTRGLPVVKQALEAFGPPGSALPNQYRQPVQRFLRTTEGEADLAAYKRAQALGQFSDLPQEVQGKIRTAIERGTTEALSPQQRRVAGALRQEYANRVAARTEQQLRPHELGAHIDEAEEVARKKRQLAVETRRFSENLKASAIPSPVEESAYLNPTSVIPAREDIRSTLRKSDFSRDELSALAGFPIPPGQGRDRGVEAALMGTVVPSGPRQIDLNTFATIGPGKSDVARSERMASLFEKKATMAEKRALDVAQGVPFRDRVAFVDRPLPPEARKELGRKAYGTPTPGGLGTGKLGRRIANPGKTTEEINAELVAQGKEPIADVVPAAIQMGEANDARVLHAKIINHLADKYGTKVEAGKGTFAGPGFESTLTGFDPKRAEALRSTKLPKDLEGFAEQLNQRLAPENFNAAQKFVRDWHGQFKKFALFSPGFVSRNMQNNVFQQALFGNMNIATWKRAGQVREAMRTGNGLDATIKVGNGTMKVADYIEDAIKRGVIGRGQTAQEIGASRIPLMTGLRNANTYGEDVSRAAFDLYNQGKGLDKMASAERVDQVLFNYGNRQESKVKKHLRTYYYPFINWDSQVPGLVVRSALERPGSLGMSGNIAARMNADAGFNNEQDLSTLGPDVVEQGGVVTGPGKKHGTRNILIPQFEGKLSANELMPDKDLQSSALSYATKLYPEFQLAAAITANKNPLTKRDFNGSPAPAPQGLKGLFLVPGGKAAMAKLGIFVGDGEVGDKGQVYAPDKVAYVLSQVPQARILSVATDMVDFVLGRAAPRSETRLKSFGTGFKELERDPSTGEAIQARNEREAMKESGRVSRKYPAGVGPNR